MGHSLQGVCHWAGPGVHFGPKTDLIHRRDPVVAAGGYTADRASVRKKKTGRPVRFEWDKETREAVDDYLKAANKRPGEFLFTGRRGANRNKTTRQYARLVSEWIGSVGLDPRLFGTHSLRRTKAILIYRRTGNLRAVQLLLETTTYCSRTSARRSDLLSVPSSVRRDRADKQAIRLSRH